MAPVSSPRLLPLDRVLRLVAAEVGTLSGLAATAGDALALALGTAARPVTPGLVRDAQALDELTQRLAGLRAYLDAVGDAAPSEVLLDVSGGVAPLTLAAQAERLSGRDDAVVRGGVVELF